MIRQVLIGAFAAALIVAPLGAGAASKSRPDLRIARVSTPDRAVTSGASLKALVTTRNAGRRRVKRSITRLYLSRDAHRSADDRRLASTRVPTLKQRMSKRTTVKATIGATLPPATGYRLLACADVRRNVRERNERNNCRAARATLTVVAKGGGPVGKPSADDDGDGTRNSGDCAPHDVDVHPGATDNPDLPASRDTNCDGIDGDETRAIFVSPIGDDSGPGTRSRPKRTMTAAVGLAASRGKDVFSTFGTYAEVLKVANRVGVYGGYRTDWTRSVSARTRFTGGAAGGPTAALATDVSAQTVLQHVTLAPAPAVAPGDGSYGLRAERSSGLVIDRVVATGGAGADGSLGATGVAGLPGGAGSPGGQGYANGGTPLPGGSGGTSPAGRTGGGGGTGGPTGDHDGSEGSPGLLTFPDGQGRMGGPGGVGGEGGDPGGAGGGGYNGDSGTRGADGPGGAGGQVLAGFWRSDPGQPGANGTGGHGGGGGGGGGGQGGLLATDGSGNSGGAGGPSIALFRHNSATTGSGNTFNFGSGGPGGGGPGFPGAPGSASATN
jgi:CARDB